MALGSQTISVDFIFSETILFELLFVHSIDRTQDSTRAVYWLMHNPSEISNTNKLKGKNFMPENRKEKQIMLIC